MKTTHPTCSSYCSLVGRVSYHTSGQYSKGRMFKREKVGTRAKSTKILPNVPLKVCTGAWEENHDTCAVLSTETCEHDFGRLALVPRPPLPIASGLGNLTSFSQVPQLTW